VPPLAETLPGFDVGLLIGLVAPAAAPALVIERLNAEIRAIAAAPDVGRLWRSQGAEPIDATAAAWGAMLEADTARWARVVREAGVRVEG
jgi:tripartite-type tricarboxylate transporter receptor subunit TctC